MRKLFIGVLSLVIVLAIHSAIQPVKAQDNPLNVAVSDKCSANCTDSDRPSFDLWGNQFDHKGNLMNVGQCPYTDPMSHQPNPYCPAPAEPEAIVEMVGK